MTSLSEAFAVLNEKVNNILNNCNGFVTKLEFNSRISPLEKIVYGLIGMILVAFMGVLINFVIKK